MNGRNRRKALAILLGLALALGAVGSTIAIEPTTSNEVMTGHTTWMEESSMYSGCLAGIAGLLKQQVTWFNGQTLFETSKGTSDDTWVYFTDGGLNPDDRIDPTDEDLFETENTYEFEDPNEDHEWTVKEYYLYDGLPDGVSGLGDIGSEDPGVNWEKIYVWAVNVNNTLDFYDSTLESDYNFVGIVDTCKFDTERERNETHDNQKASDDNHEPEWQHDSANPEGKHDHDVYMVDIWIGGEPSKIPGTGEAGSEEDGGGLS